VAFDINQKAGVMTYIAQRFRAYDDIYALRLDGQRRGGSAHVNAKLVVGTRRRGKSGGSL